VYGLSAGQPVELADLLIKGPGGDDAAQRADACRPWAGGVPQLRLRVGRCRDDHLPSAALLDEIGRSTNATKQAYTDGVLVIVDDIAARLAPDDSQSARVKTLSVFAMMVGTLQLSRALADQQLADQVLEEGIKNALLLLGAEHQT
jgi:hypothetical protein